MDEDFIIKIIAAVILIIAALTLSFIFIYKTVMQEKRENHIKDKSNYSYEYLEDKPKIDKIDKKGK